MKYNPYILAALTQIIDIATSHSGSAFSDQSSSILQLVNTERRKAGLQPLRINSALNKLATIKCQDMVDNDYFSHQSPKYGSIFDMMKSHGINYICAGENLAINNCADSAHSAWMNSKAHRLNILNPSFMEMGIGIYAKGKSTYAYAQLFIGY